jgi:hypothetical protein
MPQSDIVIAALAVPLVVLTFLRINGVMVFLGLCLGEVMLRYVGPDANSVLHFLLPHASGTVSTSTMNLVLLLGPALATAVFMVFSVRGKIRMLINILPAAGASFLGILLAVPILSPGLRYGIEGQSIWQTLLRAQDLIVGVSALMSMLYLWAQRPHHKRKEKEEGGKHHR